MEEITGQIRSSSLILVYTIHLPTVHVCTKFQSSKLHSSWEKCDEIFSIERLRNDWMTEGQGKSSIAPTLKNNEELELYSNKWAATWQNQQSDCAPSKDSDQPGHLPSLIRDFAVRMKKAWVLSYPFSAQRRLWSDWADAQADLSLHWAHTHFVGFVVLWLKCIKKMQKDWQTA